MQHWWPLPATQYDTDLGWVCPLLIQPGAELVELRMNGQTIPLEQFKVTSSYIRFINLPPTGIADAKVAINIESAPKLKVDTAIIVAIIGLTGVLATATVNYFNPHSGSTPTPKSSMQANGAMEVKKPSTITPPITPVLPPSHAAVTPSKPAPQLGIEPLVHAPDDSPDRQPNTPSSQNSAKPKQTLTIKDEIAVKTIADVTWRYTPQEFRVNTSPLFEVERCPEPEWPLGVLDAGQEETTTLKYTVNKDGKVYKVKTIQSSGYPILDDAASKSLMGCDQQKRPKLVERRPVEYSSEVNFIWKVEK